MPERTIDPVVSTAWLADHREDPDLTVLDVRGPASYNQGHVPGAVNAPQWNWMAEDSELLLQLPDAETLFETLGNLGIDSDARVVVVGGAEKLFSLADAYHVADTLVYAGHADVAVLDGGIDTWEREDRPIDTVAREPDATEFDGHVTESMFVSKGELESRLDEIELYDARIPAVYFGVELEEFTERPGHIPGATSLPAPWLWTEAGTLRDRGDLEALAEGVLGTDRSKEVILYCGASPFSKSWRYVLREFFGYETARVYEGAAQEWTRDEESPLVRYRWE
jgi:thiosulfate/3-mercaptopyruvate sulfurtransferase